MRKFFVALLLLAFVATVQAQHIAVKDFYYAENDLTARTHGTSEEDQNGNLCALIKVETTEKGMWTFDVGMLGVTKIEMQNESHSAEIWVYVPFGVTWMTIQHEHLGKLKHYQFPCSIEKGCTYVMELVTGRVETIVKEEIRQQYLLFQLDPPNAILEVDDQLWNVEADGTAMQYVDFGTYSYRVRAKDYDPEVGKVTVDDPDNTKFVPVRLKSNLAEVTLTVDADAEIWINNQMKGIRTWTGRLGNGTYKIECKQAGHETTMTSKEITTEMNGETITLPAPIPIYGSLMVESTPNLATIFVDGKEMGKTPKSLNEVLACQHEIKLSKEGYVDYIETVAVAKGERKQVKAGLNRKTDQNTSLVINEKDTSRKSYLLLRPELGTGYDMKFGGFALCFLGTVAYQLNPNFVVGIGGGYNILTGRKKVESISAYSNVRVYVNQKKIKPFFDLIMGYNFPVKYQFYAYYNDDLVIMMKGLSFKGTIGIQYNKIDFGCVFGLHKGQIGYNKDTELMIPVIAFSIAYNIQL